MQTFINSYLIKSVIVWTRSYVTAVFLALGYNTIVYANWLSNKDIQQGRILNVLYHYVSNGYTAPVREYLTLYQCVFSDWVQWTVVIGGTQILCNSLMNPQLYICIQSMA